MTELEAIIPFHLEDQAQVNRVARAAYMTRLFNRIHVVQNGIREREQAGLKMLPDVNQPTVSHHFNKQRGKAEAVAKALQDVSSPHVFLMDADLQGLYSFHLYATCRAWQRQDRPMVVQRRLNRSVLLTDLLLTGERIVETSVLQEVAGNATGYSLELALNDYHLESGFQIGYTEMPVRNPYKWEKCGKGRGILQDASMWTNLLKNGYPRQFRQRKEWVKVL